MGRLIIIGDVHGCLDELEDLLDKVQYQAENDILYFLGDIINRGPYSKEVFFRIKDLNATSVLGNHEYHAIHGAHAEHDSGYQRYLKKNFGKDFNDFLDDIRSWPLYIELKEYILVHGGIVPGVELMDSDPYMMTSIRTWDGMGTRLSEPENPPWFDFYKGTKQVVFGHWALLGGVNRHNVTGIDTGCVYGKRLTALILPEQKLVSVKARKAYFTDGSKLY